VRFGCTWQRSSACFCSQLRQRWRPSNQFPAPRRRAPASYWTARSSIRRLPAERVEVSFQTGRGIEKSHYTGVLLWTLIGEAGGIDDAAKQAELRHTISITGRDGYVVIISTGEIAPDFGGKPAMVAYERDGEELGDQALRIVMPGDKHGGRYVRDVAEIEVK
jgi:hypothetical protein